MKYLLFILFSMVTITAKAAESINHKTLQQVQNSNLNKANKIVLEFDNTEKLKEWLTKKEDDFWTRNAPLIIAFLTLFSSVLMWFLNEKSKRKLNILKQKEERYKKMVTSVKSFTEGNNDLSLRQEFIDQLNLSWIYCPDEIVTKGTFLLETMIPTADGKSKYSNDQKVKAIGDLFVEIRKDILTPYSKSKTSLTAENYKSIGTK